MGVIFGKGNLKVWPFNWRVHSYNILAFSVFVLLSFFLFVFLIICCWLLLEPRNEICGNYKKEADEDCDPGGIIPKATLCCTAKCELKPNTLCRWEASSLPPSFHPSIPSFFPPFLPALLSSFLLHHHHHHHHHLFALQKKRKKEIIQFTIMTRRTQEITRLIREATSAVINK